MEEKENCVTWKEWNEIVYELKKFKWLYKVSCMIIHDMDGTPIEEIDKDLNHLWDLFKNKDIEELQKVEKENKKNVN